MIGLAEFPRKLDFLFERWRYKVAYGGRFGLKSWSFAKALLIQAAERRLRILCAREVQKSIKQSVYTLLVDQINMMGFGGHYDPYEAIIRGRNGSEFLFSGLAEHTVETIKSFEGVDIVWVEEAQTVKDKSWKILIPTIRKPGSEIWVSFNPDMETDATYQRFVINPPTNSRVVMINYDDVPKEWRTEEMEQERRDCLRDYPDDYPNIWEGKCKAAVEGAIYAKQIADAIDKKRICNVPYDPQLKVHVIMDLGWNDLMAILLVQKIRSEIRVIKYIEDSHKTLDWYSAELKKLNYNWGTLFLPHDGKAADFKTGRSSVQIMEGLNWNVSLIPMASVEEGIKAVRGAFHQVYFDREETGPLVEHLKRYKRHVPKSTDEASKPVHDVHSHGADGLRYVIAVADEMTNDDQPSANPADYMPTVRIV